MAYLPEAIDDFREMDHLLGYVMDPYARKPTAEHEMTSDQAWQRFKAVHSRVQDKVESRLKRLL